MQREDCDWYWEQATLLPWGDVKLCEGWHLNPQRIPVPPMPTSRCARDLEVDRRRLPTSLRNDPAYAAPSRNWDTWFIGEHDLRRQTYYTRAPTPPPSSRWDLPPHMRRRDAPPLSRSVPWATARALRIGSPPPPSPPLVKMEADADDERKWWDQVLANTTREKEEAVAAQQAAVLEEPLEWWQVPMGVDLPPTPPLPEGLVGMR